MAPDSRALGRPAAPRRRGALAGVIGRRAGAARAGGRPADAHARLRRRVVFMLVGVYGWSDCELGNDIGVVFDPSRDRVLVVSGIGFLGAGAIIRHGHQRPRADDRGVALGRRGDRRLRRRGLRTRSPWRRPRSSSSRSGRSQRQARCSPARPEEARRLAVTLEPATSVVSRARRDRGERRRDRVASSSARRTTPAGRRRDRDVGRAQSASCSTVSTSSTASASATVAE